MERDGEISTGNAVLLLCGLLRARERFEKFEVRIKSLVEQLRDAPLQLPVTTAETGKLMSHAAISSKTTATTMTMIGRIERWKPDRRRR